MPFSRVMSHFPVKAVQGNRLGTLLFFHFSYHCHTVEARKGYRVELASLFAGSLLPVNMLLPTYLLKLLGLCCSFSVITLCSIVCCSPAGVACSCITQP